MSLQLQSSLKIKKIGDKDTSGCFNFDYEIKFDLYMDLSFVFGGRKTNVLASFFILYPSKTKQMPIYWCKIKSGK